MYSGLFDTDYSQIPDKDFQMRWIHKYLKHKAIQNGCPEKAITDAEVQNLSDMVDIFTKVSYKYVLLKNNIL